LGGYKTFTQTPREALESMKPDFSKIQNYIQKFKSQINFISVPSSLLPSDEEKLDEERRMQKVEKIVFGQQKQTTTTEPKTAVFPTLP
jgi:hypothetical protein